MHCFIEKSRAATKSCRRRVNRLCDGKVRVMKSPPSAAPEVNAAIETEATTTSRKRQGPRLDVGFEKLLCESAECNKLVTFELDLALEYCAEVLRKLQPPVHGRIDLMFTKDGKAPRLCRWEFMRPGRVTLPAKGAKPKFVNPLKVINPSPVKRRVYLAWEGAWKKALRTGPFANSAKDVRKVLRTAEKLWTLRSRIVANAKNFRVALHHLDASAQRAMATANAAMSESRKASR